MLPGVDRWLRVYLSSLALIPLGLIYLILGVTRSSESLAITLVVLGAGLVVFGAFGPRMEGSFKIGPSGAEGGLSHADATMVAAAHLRLNQAAEAGEVSPDVVPGLEEAATKVLIAASNGPPPRRYLVLRQTPTDPADVGTKVAEAILEAAKVTRGPH